MNNSKIDSNIKLILDLKNNKGVFPLSSESAIISHSPGGEMTYLDSVIDYLYQQIANRLRLYTELDGSNTRGKAYPATMGVKNSNNIASILNSLNSCIALVNALLERLDNIDPEGLYNSPPINYCAPINTTTVGADGFIMENGRIVATNMPMGATVNIKDCIVYTDITEDISNEEYEVINYGDSSITIGNIALAPKSSTIIKAATDTHIDLSNIEAIDASDLYNIDPVVPVEPFYE